MVTDPEKFEAFRESHAALSFHIAALMQAALRIRESEHMEALGHVSASSMAEYNYHKSKVRALVHTL